MTISTLQDTNTSGAMRDMPQWVARLLDSPLTLLATRVCLTLPFWVSGLVKLFSWQTGVAEMAQFGLSPAWVFNIATIVTQLGGSALVILNRKTWLGAGALGVFTLIATVIGHPLANLSAEARAAQVNIILEHIAIAAGFVLVAVVALRRNAAGRAT